PRLLVPLLVPWRLFGFAMGFVMTRVILTLFFFLVISPTAIVRRLLSKDSLERSLDAAGPTWWRERDGGPPPRERYERQF
ncbi:MAG: SxtJ family membrane protein, partial [Planctomycetota bacterium]